MTRFLVHYRLAGNIDGNCISTFDQDIEAPTMDGVESMREYVRLENDLPAGTEVIICNFLRLDPRTIPVKLWFHKGRAGL